MTLHTSNTDQSDPTIEEYMREMNIDYAVIQQVKKIAYKKITLRTLNSLKRQYKKEEFWLRVGDCIYYIDERIKELKDNL